MLIGVPAESFAGETRVAVTPETAKKLKAQGHTLRIQSGAGVRASVTDAAYEAVGAEITDETGAWSCDLLLKVRAPSVTELTRVKPGTALVVQELSEGFLGVSAGRDGWVDEKDVVPLDKSIEPLSELIVADPDNVPSGSV